MDGSNFWIDRQVHYKDTALRRSPHYKGIASHMSEDEAAALHWEMFRYFADMVLPPPPVGLPGALRPVIDDDVMDVLSVGVAYYTAILRKEPRSQINQYERAAKALRKAYWDGYNKRDADYREQMRREDEARGREIMEQAPKAPADFVYFIGAPDGPIKIGVSANPESRLRALQTSHPTRLGILVTCGGGQPAEQAYHRQFAQHRLSGEWFERHPDILAEIARLSDAA